MELMTKWLEMEGEGIDVWKMIRDRGGELFNGIHRNKLKWSEY